MRSINTVIHISLFVCQCAGPFPEVFGYVEAHNRRDLTVRYIRSQI